MSSRRSIRRRKARKARKVFSLQKANGTLHPRVQEVGPEHFGIVAFDCAKARSKWLMSDFYGRILVEPTAVEHERGQLETAITMIRETAEQRQIKDLVVAVERTGNYHTPIIRAFAKVEWQGKKIDKRIVHPFATKQHRQAANPDDKTDDHDLAAIVRATVQGFGLLESSWDDIYQQLQLLARHRRDLVEKRSAVCCQLREELELVLPGYAAIFGPQLWDSHIAMELVRHVVSPSDFQIRGVHGLATILRAARVKFHEKTLQRIIAWSGNAVTPADQSSTRYRIIMTLDDDRRRKTQEIRALEGDLAQLLAATPYLLLLCCPGINVISASEVAGEMGPIENYASANRITGRAGLYRSRYQSDEVDLQNGSLVRLCNRRLRAVLMMIADNLATCNPHYRGLAQLWKLKGQDERYIRTKIATKFTRLMFQLVAGRQVLRHPSMNGRDYILDKLLKFYQGHDTPPDVMLTNLQQSILQLPTTCYAEEAAPLAALLEKTRAARRGVKPLADVLPIVLARLGVGTLQSVSETREPN